MQKLLTVATTILLTVGGTAFAYLGPDRIKPIVGIDTNPSALAVADFNRDGHLDIALSGNFNETFGSLPRGYIFLGDGSGHFSSPPLPFDAWGGPAAVADFNGDSNPDLVMVSQNIERFTVYLGDGAGGFATSVSESLCVGPCFPSSEGFGLAVGDFYGDGAAHVVVTWSPPSGYIWRGNGSGGLERAEYLSPADYDNQMPGFAVAAADFDLDGTQEIACAGNYGTVWLMQDPFSEGFLTPNVPTNLWDLAAGDFDHDGVPDLVVATEDATLTFMRGTGTGFVRGGTYPLGGAAGLVITDLNRDSHLDVVAGPRNWPQPLSFVLGDGEGSFAAPVTLAAGGVMGGPIAADFNEDGFPDVAILTEGQCCDSSGNFQGVDLALFLSITNTPLGQNVNVSPVDSTTGGTPVSLRFAEVMERGYTSVRTSSEGPEPPDGFLLGSPLTYYWLATEPPHTGPIEVCVNYSGISYTDESALKLLQGAGGSWQDVTTSLDTAGDRICGMVNELGPAERPFLVAAQGPGLPAIGLFGPPHSVTSDWDYQVTDIAIADFNRDGSMDVAVPNSVNALDPNTAATVDIYCGDGAGGLTGPTPFPAGVFYLANLVAADFNNDGAPDVAAISNWDVEVLLGDGQGHLGPPVPVYLSSPDCPGYAIAEDLNHDSSVDLAIACEGQYGSVLVLLGDGAGGVYATSRYAVDFATVEVTAADFNLDGTVDLAVGGGDIDELLLLVGDGLGGFPEEVRVPANDVYGVHTGDFNRDGAPDLVTAGGENTVSILIGNGNNSFAISSQVLQSSDLWPWQPRVADFNGDGHLDIATIGESTTTVRLGYGDGSFGPRGSYLLHAMPTALRVADMNNDRAPDLVLAGYPYKVSVFLNVSTNTRVGPTPPDSPVTPTDATTGTVPVEIYFANATSSGFTGLSTSTTGPPPPEGFKLGAPPTYYDITTTATYTGTITICINYAGTSYPRESSLEIWHGLPGGGWERLPNVVRYPDEDRICADTTSLSPFIVAYPEDTTPPTISLVAPQDGVSYPLNAEVLSAYSCDDVLSGVQACAGTIPNGAPLDTASVGPKTFSVTAVDGAGNTATVNATYRAVYAFTGFLQPVDNLPVVNVVNAGRTIPVKWRLADAAGTSVSSLSSFVSIQSNVVNCDSSPPDTIPDSATSLSEESLQYDSAGGQFVYHWRTDKSWTSTCRQIWLTLADGTIHTAKFKFK